MSIAQSRALTFALSWVLKLHLCKPEPDIGRDFADLGPVDAITRLDNLDRVLVVRDKTLEHSSLF